MAGAFGFALCAIVFGALIGLIIGSVILRCACWMYNKMVGAPAGGPRFRDRDDDYDDRPRRVRRRRDEEDEEDEETDDEEDDRPRLRRGMSAFDADAPGVPEPTTGRAMGIIAINWVIGFVVGLVMGLALGAGLGGPIGPGGGAIANLGLQLVSSGVQLVVGFLTLAWLLSVMLPTKFGRACAVAALTYVVIILVVAVIVGVLVAIGVGFGAARRFGG